MKEKVSSQKKVYEFKKWVINFDNSECHAVKLQHVEDRFRAFQRPLMEGDSLVMLVGLLVDDRQGWIQTKARKRQETGREDRRRKTWDRRERTENERARKDMERLGWKEKLVGAWQSDKYRQEVDEGRDAQTREGPMQQHLRAHR